MNNKVFSILFLSIITCFSLGYILQKEQTISISERRKKTVGQDVRNYAWSDPFFYKELEKYAQDQLPFREQLRMLKYTLATTIGKQKDVHGIYKYKESWMKRKDVYEQRKTNIFLNKMKIVLQAYPEVDASYMILPDKTYYEQQTTAYDTLLQDITLPSWKAIKVHDVLQLQDYFLGDPHLKQEAYIKLLPSIQKAFGKQEKIQRYTANTYDNFYGSYCAQVSCGQREPLTYVHNDVIDQARVAYLDKPDSVSVYDKNDLSHLDPYDVFLSGPSSFLRISNDRSTSEDTLVMIRDSFGSSLAPVLIPYYKTIYLVDLRYISFAQAQTLIKEPVTKLLFVFGETSIQNNENFR